ncbi:MAG TPA: SH3 domain-containing C40 family peptidase [Fimbriimonadaceae bacterium]|nr:SH3 domain-containing C40 family peptidase [Fimbriimonadaceae bacterium]
MKLLRALPLLTLLLCAAYADASKVVLGKLGQAVKPTTIHATPTTKGRVYYRVKQYEYLVVQDSSAKGWMKVLLANGMYGYVKTDLVAKLPYEVTSDQPIERNVRANLPGDARAAMARYSLNFVGTPYVWGGNDVSSGIDCSGFVKNLYGKIGLSLPRTAAQQALVGTPIYRYEDLRPGDRLYFWEAKRNKIGHTGIYLGNGYFVHSSSGRGGVATDHLAGAYWKKNLVAARR